ncbi:MAG: chemotaxis protein CheX [Desulfobacteraceae bacterium]|nr:chemotaxis protein CheX [Desulfobacteraceae bacterium]
MKQQIKETLYRVAEDILEKLAFIFSFPEEERESIDYDSAVAASVSFKGPFTGTLVMAVSEHILPELAGNMLGVENPDDTTLDQQHDALKELINVICGNLLPSVAGKEIVFNVDAPVIISKDEAILRGDGPDPVAVARMDLDDQQCDLLFFIDGDIPENIGTVSESTQ